MKTMMKGLLAIGLLSLGACAAPAISDIAADKVKVDSSMDNLEGATAEAERGCALYKRHPVYLSKRRVTTGPYSAYFQFLFACMAPGHANVQVQPNS
jgi:hypothetical protein